MPHCARRLRRYDAPMAKRSRKPRDLNSLAASIVRDATTDGSGEPAATAAQTNGRVGGLKGGKARAAKLTAAERSEIARKAAKARWAHHTPTA